MAETSLLEQDAFPLPTGAYEALVVGGGITGVGMLWELKDHGFTRIGMLEQGSGVGGTWFWNRYPGARVDSESYSYGYFRDSDLMKDWRWTELFAAQPETERYLNHVVDRFGLREHIVFDSKVESAVWDESTRLWTVKTDRAEFVTRVLVTAMGAFSVPNFPPYSAGRDKFAGVQAHSALWPAGGIDVAGKKVAVVGTGSSGIQIIPMIAGEVETLTVFQRTANWATPLNNTLLPDAEFDDFLARADEIHAKCLTGFGFIHYGPTVPAAETTAEERRAHFEYLYGAPGLTKMTANYMELFSDRALNKEFTDYLAERVRARVNDPAIADKLIPTDHAFTAKRPPMESGYFEAFNRPNVELVSLRDEPIEEVTEAGLRTSKREFEFDVIIWATGFDTNTGAFDAIEIKGVDGNTLRDAWSESPYTTAGVQTPGFPNLFMLGGPHAIGGNFPRGTEVQQVFVRDLLSTMRAEGQTRAETEPLWADEWTAHALLTGMGPLSDPDMDYNYGANIVGKKKVFRAYLGGLDGLKGKLEESRSAEFAGFRRD